MKDPTAKLELDRERTLRLDYNTFADIQEATGLNALEGEPFQEQHITQPRVLRAVLWACLRDEDPELSERDAGRLMTLGNIQQIVETIGNLYRQAVPEELAEKAQQGAKGKAPKQN